MSAISLSTVDGTKVTVDDHSPTNRASFVFSHAVGGDGGGWNGSTLCVSSVDFLTSSLARLAAHIPNLSSSVIDSASFLDGKNKSKTKIGSGYAHLLRSLRKKSS